MVKKIILYNIEENANKLYRETDFDLVLTKDFLTGLLNIKNKFLDRLFQMVGESAFRECYMDFYMKLIVSFNNKSANF